MARLSEGELRVIDLVVRQHCPEGDLTFEMCGALAGGLKRERIRQIQDRALRKLRGATKGE